MTRESAAINVGPGHDRPDRARACLLTDEAGAAPAAGYAKYRPRLDETPRRVIDSADRPDAPSADSGPAGSPELRTRGKQPATRDGWHYAGPPMMGRRTPPDWCA